MVDRLHTHDVIVASSELTHTKLVPPRLPLRYVALDRHAKWLQSVLAFRVTLVRAESGYGKSTFCAGLHFLLRNQGSNVGWVSFASDDDNPDRAVSYIVAAVQMALPEGRRMPEFGPGWHYDELVPPQSIAARLINAIHAFNTPVLLFLDDPDKLSQPSILQFLNYLMLHGPDNLHLILSCQTQPSLPFRHLAQYDQLLRVGAEELCLSDAEAEALLTRDGGHLESSEIRRLNTAMGGWVTGLKIGSAAMLNNRDALNDIGLVQHAAQWLSDYLDDNIFQHLPSETQRFLMRVSAVEEMTAPLCGDLSEISSAEAGRLLLRLAEQNLFVQRLDDSGMRFRIHPVFRSFLREKLVLDEPAMLRELHRRASRWFAGQGEVAAAIAHALDGDDTAAAAALVDIAGMPMVERSEIVTLLSWIARLPGNVLEHRWQARIAQAWALTLSLRPQARELLVDLRAAIAKMDDRKAAAALETELDGIETVFLAIVEDRIAEAAPRGHAFLAQPRNEDSFSTRAVRNVTAYCEYNRGQHALIHDLVRPSQLHARHIEQIYPTAYRCCILGMTYRAQGQLADAERTYRAGLDLAEQMSGRQSISSALVACFYARSLYERGDFEGAMGCLDERRPIVDVIGFCDAAINAYLVSVRCLVQAERLGEAAALIEHAELIGHERGWDRLLAACIVERTRLGLSSVLSPDRLLPIELEAEAMASPMGLAARTAAILFEARAYEAVAAGDFARTRVVSQHLAFLANQARCRDLRLKSVVVGLLPLLYGITPEEPLDSETAGILATAVEQGFYRTIADMVEARIGRGIVLRSAPGIPAQVAAILAQARRYGSTADRSPISVPPNISVFQLLTSREIDVLTALSRGDSNKHIARRLHLTPETVKWHLRNIMRKLDSESRTEAVAKAAALGLSLSHEEMA